MVLELWEKNICTDILTDLLNHNGYINNLVQLYLLFVVVSLTELKYIRNSKYSGLLRWQFIIGVPLSNDSYSSLENNDTTNYILLSQQIVKEIMKILNLTFLTLLESRKRVEFWTKSTMHACRGIVFGGITGKGK